MSQIKNGRLGLYGAEHSKCNHMMTLGFKGLKATSLLDGKGKFLPSTKSYPFNYCKNVSVDYVQQKNPEPCTKFDANLSRVSKRVNMTLCK